MKISGRPTATGWMFLGFGVISASSSLYYGNSYFFLLFCLLLGIFLFSAFSCWLRIRGLSFKRIFPEPFYALSTSWYRLEASSDGVPDSSIRITVRELLNEDARNQWFAEQKVKSGIAIGPGQPDGNTSICLRPRTRGKISLTALEISSSYPLGLLEFRIRIPQKDEVTVHPRIARFLPSALPDLLKHRTSYGAARAPQPERFAGVREYRRGDDPRRIYWKSLARPGDDLLVKLFDSTPGGEILFLIETAVLEHRTRRREWIVENILGASLALLRSLLQRGIDVRVLLNAEPFADIHLKSGKDTTNPVVEAMVQSEPSRKRGFMEVEDSIRKHSENIICAGFRVETLYSDALWAPEASWMDLHQPGSTGKLIWDSQRKLPEHFQE